MAAAKKDRKNALLTASAMRQMDEKDLRAKLQETREELMQDRFKHATAALEKTSELKTLRRQIARMETVLNQKEQRS